MVVRSPRHGAPQGSGKMSQSNDDLHERYGLPECRAIEEHKYFLGTELHRDPGLKLAIESWEKQYAVGWRSEKMRRDAEEQVRAIESYRQELNMRWHREVSFKEAAREWVERWSEEWRRHREFDPQPPHADE
jgi:hypothetical protein